MVLSLSKQDVKRIAIRAQGLDHNRVATSKANDACKCPKVVTIGDIRRSILAMGLLQIDAVNVCVRSHYMPLFSRLGIYHRELLDQLAYKEKEIFETWAHAACFVPVERHFLFRHRMAQQKPRPLVEKLKKDRPDYLENVLSQVTSRGQLSASELEGSGKRQGCSLSSQVVVGWSEATGADDHLGALCRLLQRCSDRVETNTFQSTHPDRSNGISTH